MSEAQEQTKDLQDLRHDKVIDLARERFTKLAPKPINFDAEKGYAIQLLENNDYLMKAAMENRGSLLQAVTNVAAIGLSLNPAKKQAYLIPRNVKQGGKWITKVFLEPSYMGLCDLATMSGSIKWVQANIVYSNDTFEDNGPGEKPTHTYSPFAKQEQRGEFVGTYCVAKTAEGDYLTTIMTAEEIYSVRDRSESWKAYQEGRAKSGGPWQTDFNEQAKKTVIRRGFKTWPKTDTLERMEMAVNLSNENEGFEPLQTSPNTSHYTVNQKEYFDQLIEKDDAIGMFLFSKSIEYGVFTNLYHSFEKGTKGKYQQIVDGLVQRGQSLLFDMAQVIDEHSRNNDLAGIKENIDDLSQEAIDWLMNNVSAEAAGSIKEAQE